MPKGKEITFYEREQIETYLRMKKKKIWIAKRLNRDYSIIKREIKRNSGKVLSYSASNAEHYAERRKRNTNKKKLEKYDNEKLKEYVEEKLEDGWSPEQIAGALKEHPPNEIRDPSKNCVQSTLKILLERGILLVPSLSFHSYCFLFYSLPSANTDLLIRILPGNKKIAHLNKNVKMLNIKTELGSDIRS
ncbi:MAG: helix-turn-helix domain-containing protein [Patescibacteria group bacterium]|nr:helix-turn-helix domain-containing protein [Patescibacteria group bacterium]